MLGGDAQPLAADAPDLFIDDEAAADRIIGLAVHFFIAGEGVDRNAGDPGLREWHTRLRDLVPRTVGDVAGVRFAGVTGETAGTGRRPHLTTGNKLMGTGAFVEQPTVTDDYRRGYLRGFGNFTFPIQVTALYDSSITRHDVQGAAGSYALLSGSPMGMSGGSKLGIKIVNELFAEVFYQRSFFGQRYPSYNQFGFSLFYALDFLETLAVKQVREVPFDSDNTDFYKGK